MKAGCVCRWASPGVRMWGHLETGIPLLHGFGGLGVLPLGWGGEWGRLNECEGWGGALMGPTRLCPHVGTAPPPPPPHPVTS